MRELVIDLSGTSHVWVDTTHVCQLVGGLRLIHDMCVRWHVLCEMTCIVWDGLRLIHDMYCVRWHTNYGVLDDLVMTNTQTWQKMLEQTATHCSWCVGWLGHDLGHDQVDMNNSHMNLQVDMIYLHMNVQVTHESPSQYGPSHTWMCIAMWIDIAMMILMMTYQWWYQWWYCKICHTSG